jgi:hypothetical protein
MARFYIFFVTKYNVWRGLWNGYIPTRCYCINSILRVMVRSGVRTW